VTPFSPALQAYVAQHAPAVATGAVDYALLLRDYNAQFDFYDSREHLATMPGAALADAVAVRAGALAARGVGPGDRIVMIAANTETYVTTLLAVLLLGAVPCAVAAPPTPSREDSAGVQHLRAALQVVAPVLVLGPPETIDALSHLGLIGYDELDGGRAVAFDRPGPGPSDIHHIQLTSGSTSQPKAVVLTHANVAHNLGVLASGMDVERGNGRMFSWLPMYHDMGLVQVLGGLVYGAPVGLMSPLGFLRDPLSWLRHMSSHGSTVTAGPTFAYRAVLEAFGRAPDRAGHIDLGALQYAFVGAEPIVYQTLRHFTDTFAPLGLRPDVLVPCYGMAESVLATTLALRSAPEGAPNFGRVRVAPDAGGGEPPVSCGPPVEGIRVAVVDSAGNEVEPGVVGDIRISGPSVMAGYRQADGTVTAPPDGWHDTGDRGFRWDGELFVVGRTKEMLIVRGRNLPPYDIERVIGELPEVGQGQAVVFSVTDQVRGGERNVAVVAAGVTAEDDQRSLRDEAMARVRRVFGFSLDEVVVVSRRAIPRTTSGKIQRLKLREWYRAGRL
jgi:fatty-acyl-CoA synthase